VPERARVLGSLHTYMRHDIYSSKQDSFIYIYIYAYMRHGGLESHACRDCPSYDVRKLWVHRKEARKFFDNLTNRDVFSWNVMMQIVVVVRKHINFFLQMKQEGFKPDAITYTSILNACASAGAFELVMEVHRHFLESGLELDLQLGKVQCCMQRVPVVLLMPDLFLTDCRRVMRGVMSCDDWGTCTTWVWA
jgi:pentatricopeptide repeat protein